MTSIQKKIHELVDRTSDPTALENIYEYLKHVVHRPEKDILDDLSVSDVSSLYKSIDQARAGETKTHEEILELLRQWRSK